jgi:acyl-coenzyme A thioesterase PaaI-like protein
VNPPPSIGIPGGIRNGILPRSVRETVAPCPRAPGRQAQNARFSMVYDAFTGLASPLLYRVGMTTALAPERAHSNLVNSQTEAHPFCFVCSGSNPMGLALRYEPQPDGSVCARFLGHSALEGYAGLLHGGVIAAMLDGAMTNCLFAHGIRGLTAELKVRYHQRVSASEVIGLRAWLENDAHGLYQLQAELTQGDAVKASAAGKFMKQHE